MDENILFQNVLDETSVKLKPKLDFSLMKLFEEKKQTIAVVETITDGRLTTNFKKISGSLIFFKGSLVCHNVKNLIKLLGLLSATIKNKGWYSPEIATEMAKGAKKLFNTDIGVAVTGNLKYNDPILNKNNEALIYISMVTNKKTIIKHYKFFGTMSKIQNNIIEAVFIVLKYMLLNQNLKEEY
ncbi:nicotinamide-nucleotide amidohydrolase family protein [bacterium]|jgi:nicotinamide-nucleotide amidase|nr:nicotinamide-nucleotide amidohydrolase family protein [bacterium]MBT3581232.1 nicotinamide-nucleotide amidohydrolase family protein [bacterium]MBT4552353.1 nicotinamide-nucleotide amidohydrolase family protein [bacterium]MBT5988338.1 nicotinamide-nucleotide amidohydrolase family protein [bacterium]MBT7088074.1 nicotinamide-nucleotide amidohydrolase family protein [bacterium]